MPTRSTKQLTRENKHRRQRVAHDKERLKAVTELGSEALVQGRKEHRPRRLPKSKQTRRAHKLSSKQSKVS